MGKSSGSSDSTQTQVSTPPSWALGNLQEGLSEASRLYNQGPYSYYPGQTYAGLTPLQLEGLRQQEQFARSTAPRVQNQIFNSFGQALDASNIVDNPAVSAGLQSIEDRANRNFSESILPQLRQQATGTGNEYSSKAEQSERLAARDLQSVISDAQANLLTGSIGDAMRLQGSGLALAPQTLGTGLFGGSTLQGLGGVYQGQNQAAIDEAMARYGFNQSAPQNALNTYINQIQPLAGFGGSVSANTDYDQGGISLGGILGGGLLGNAAANTITSNVMMPLGMASGLGWGLPLAGAVLGGLYR